MRRLRSSIIALIVVIVLIFISARALGLHLSQEKVLEASEAAMHYGPSDDVLYKYTGSDGRGIIIAECGDEGLSVIRTKRVLGFLYKADDRVNNGMNGYLTGDSQIPLWFDRDLDMIYGLSYGEPDEDLVVKIGTEYNGPFSQRVTTDERGFFCIRNVSTSYLLEDLTTSQEAPYIYAESVFPVEGTAIRMNTNMTKGLIVDRSELDEIMPGRDDFMPEEEMKNIMNFSADALNRINAGLKEYTGIDFFAYNGWADGETVGLNYGSDLWDGIGLQLRFKKDGDRFVPEATDENMNTAAVSWLLMNFGKKYDIINVSSTRISVTEENGKKQYRTVLSSYLRLRSNGVFGEMNVEVVVEADLNDPAAPWKMYYVSDTYGPDGTWELRDISELTVASYDVENGVYIINGYDAGHMEYVPANQATSNNSTDWTYVGELYFADPYFLGDYFRGKTAEGGAAWADKNKESISFWFTIDAGGGGAVAGPTVSATVNLKTNEIVESDFSGFELLPFTDDELINMGHRLADIIEGVEGII